MPRPPKYVAAAAEHLAPGPPRLFVGTSGWAYPSWKPDFYPQDVPSRAFLHFYASRLSSVEVNYTFRTLPTAAQLEGWLGVTPPGFRFSFKAPQRITHFARLRACSDHLTQLAEALAPVVEAGKMGPILFQLPPNFKADTERLAAFLQLPALRSASLAQIAFEFRHESWFQDDVYGLLRDANAALCVADTDDLATPDVVTASFRCHRLRRDGGYTAPEIQAFAVRFAELAKSTDTYVYFRHQDEPTGALHAAELIGRAALAEGRKA